MKSSIILDCLFEENIPISLDSSSSSSLINHLATARRTASGPTRDLMYSTVLYILGVDTSQQFSHLSPFCG